jgi:predicted nucleotidyltransferase
MTDFWKKPDLLVRTGSHLYGCNVATSDEDTRGFAVPSADYLLGRKQWEQHETKEPDCVIWSFPKFFNLLERFSPNTAEILFAPKEHILKATEAGQLMINNRNLFVSKKLIKPMQGFAFGEWKKAVDYFEQMRKLGAQRKEHIATFGYSIKNAYHAVRLLEECIELLQTGNITFPRPNADFLRKIRHGEVDVEDVKARYEELDKKVPEELTKSSIPENVDREKLDKLFYEVIAEKMHDFMAEKYLVYTLGKYGSCCKH